MNRIEVKGIMCVNETCDNDVLTTPGAVRVNDDGDYACSRACARKYKKQRDYFFEVIIHDNRKLSEYFGVPIGDPVKKRIEKTSTLRKKNNIF